MVPMVLVVSVLASALLRAQLRLLDQSFRRRVQGRLSIASEMLKMEQRDLEERCFSRPTCSLRDMPETREIPVAMTSGDATPGQIERLRAAGADLYLTKPLDINMFLSVLDDALAKRGSHLAGRHA